jgi:hypothetical protein
VTDDRGDIAARLGTHWGVDPPQSPDLQVAWGDFSRYVSGDVSVLLRQSMPQLNYTVLIPEKGWEFIPLIVAQNGTVVVMVSWKSLNDDNDVSFTVAGISADPTEAEHARNRVRDEIQSWVDVDHGTQLIPAPDG